MIRTYIVGHDHGCPTLGNYSKRGRFVAVRREDVDSLLPDLCGVANVQAKNKREAIRIAREHPQYFCIGRG